MFSDSALRDMGFELERIRARANLMSAMAQARMVELAEAEESADLAVADDPISLASAARLFLREAESALLLERETDRADLALLNAGFAYHGAGSPLGLLFFSLLSRRDAAVAFEERADAFSSAEASGASPGDDVRRRALTVPEQLVRLLLSFANMAGGRERLAQSLDQYPGTLVPLAHRTLGYTGISSDANVKLLWANSQHK